MTISIRESGAAQVVDVKGDVDLGSSPDLRQALFNLLNKRLKVAVNLREVRYIDSSGIATLIEALKNANVLQREFVLFGLSPAVQDAFRLTHVNRIFRVFDTEEQALTQA